MRILIRKADMSFEKARNSKFDPVITYDHMAEQGNEKKKQMLTNQKQSTWAYFIMEEAIIACLLIMCVWVSL